MIWSSCIAVLFIHIFFFYQAISLYVWYSLIVFPYSLPFQSHLTKYLPISIFYCPVSYTVNYITAFPFLRCPSFPFDSSLIAVPPVHHLLLRAVINSSRPGTVSFLSLRFGSFLRPDIYTFCLSHISTLSQPMQLCISRVPSVATKLTIYYNPVSLPVSSLPCTTLFLTFSWPTY